MAVYYYLSYSVVHLPVWDCDLTLQSKKNNHTEESPSDTHTERDLVPESEHQRERAHGNRSLWEPTGLWTEAI